MLEEPVNICRCPICCKGILDVFYKTHINEHKKMMLSGVVNPYD